jgi:XTP/dITP diphosphohydrolase
MPTLVFATNNAHKAEEIRAALKAGWEIRTLKEAGIDIDIPEPFDTLEENAREKSSVIHQLTGTDCFSEDTGLEVETLGGAPGVKSARYAGESRSFEDNITKLLGELKGKQNRRARFRTVISFLYHGLEYQFEGICNGIIIEKSRGDDGFGYDPVFVPEGDTRTFAEMSLAEKNRYSHRKKALDKLISFLQQEHQG